MKRHDEDQKKLYGIVLAAIMGSTGVNQSIQMLFPARLDPFTGKDSIIMEQRIKHDIEVLRDEYQRYKLIDEDRMMHLLNEIEELQELRKDHDKAVHRP